MSTWVQMLGIWNWNSFEVELTSVSDANKSSLQQIFFILFILFFLQQIFTMIFDNNKNLIFFR